MRWQTAAALTFSRGNTYMMNLNSLCGRKEKRRTNAIAGTVKILTLESHNIPSGTRKYESAMPLGSAE